MHIWDDILYGIKEKKLQGKIVAMAAALLILAGLVGVQHSIPTSSTVGDRELPIYCVETDEPKIALTFDAAWGNCQYGHFLRYRKNRDITGYQRNISFFIKKNNKSIDIVCTL